MNPVTASTASAGMLRRDFPGWLPPMLIKELRQGLHTRGFVGALMLFQIFMVLLMLVALSNQAVATAGTGTTTFTDGFFWTIIGVQLLLVTPSRALGGLQLEVESRTLDLLMLTRLNAWRIVLGKWISLLAQAVLLLVAMLPYLVVRYFTDRADILADLGRCGALLGFSAVLTAAGLWASGIAKVLRVVVVVLLVVGAQSMGGTFFSLRFFRGGPPLAAGSLLFRLFESPFDFINAGLITAFFLVSAVRNIAPPAENHCFFTRLLPLLATLTAPLAELIGAHDIAVRQLMVSGGFLAFVLVFELAREAGPRASQWRDWGRRGPLTRAVGRCALPGWPSALLFALFGAVAWGILALIVLPTGTVTSREWAEHTVWLACLALVALVFPAVLQAMVRTVPVPPLIMYACGIGLPMLLAVVGVVLAETKWKFTLLKALMEVVPVSSFYFALAGHAPGAAEPQPAFIVSFAGIAAVLVLAAAFWQSRPYWHQIALFDARDRQERWKT